jgi:exosortase A-associated hydrolase 2
VPPASNPHPFFLARNRLFGLYFRPDGDSPRQAILHVPAFAEEMNKSRRMTALQARALAARGFGVLLLDLYGTGDSAGDFAEARWPVWLDDVAAGVEWLREQGAECVSLWALRAGALLALDRLRSARLACERLLLWQPVLSGELFLNQFLRLRVASGMLSRTGQETVKELQQRLLDGECLEVAGYTLHPEWARALMALNFQKNALSPDIGPLGLMEIAGPDQIEHSPLYRKFVETCRAGQIPIDARIVAGEPFWSTQEIAEAPALIAATLNYFDTDSHAR